ncbi:MAG: hydroxylamine reductase [bacterium]|nr:hydroxylamine reductase [bacterium]
MFCYQCEQTAKGTGCTQHGVCGKDATTAALQDVLVHVTKGVAMYARRARALGKKDRSADVFVIEALFTTVTNVNFDPERVLHMIRRGVSVREGVKALYEQACAGRGIAPEQLNGPATFIPGHDIAEIVAQAGELGILARKRTLGDDIAGLLELITYGVKGMAAYADHAMILGVEDDGVFAFFHEVLDLLTRESHDMDALLRLALQVGEMNLRVMGMLDQANTRAYGQPEPTRVRVTPVKGKAIVVSGHDLKDLEELLKQTAGMGINVYTHGEMLPALAYPGLKKYPHLVGNYGGAWQDQQKEFAAFPGAIVMTTNCLQRPLESYKDRIFTSGLVAWPGVPHIRERDFTPVIAAAQAAPGFAEDAPEQTIMIGFAHHAVLQVAQSVVEAVKSGAIRHFFLIGGCDGAKPGRNYYTEFAQRVPEDCVILTLACGKYRFNKLDFGTIDGIPRLLDCGQCNDAYSAIQIATALAEAFQCGVNDLPLSLVLSWYEQKAVCILLTLLHLGIKNIYLGPSLPAFLTPAALKVLVDLFALKPITTPAQDLARILGR